MKCAWIWMCGYEVAVFLIRFFFVICTFRWSELTNSIEFSLPYFPIEFYSYVFVATEISIGAPVIMCWWVIFSMVAYWKFKRNFQDMNARRIIKYQLVEAQKLREVTRFQLVVVVEDLKKTPIGESSSIYENMDTAHDLVQHFRLMMSLCSEVICGYYATMCSML